MALKIDPATLSPSGHWKADSLSGDDGSVVGTWADSSGNGRDLTQTAAKKPLLRLGFLNDLSAVRFDGTDDAMRSGANFAVFLGANGIGTIIALVRPAGVAVTVKRGIWGASVANGTDMILRADLTPKVFQARNSSAGGLDIAAMRMPPDAILANQGPYINSAPLPHLLMWRKQDSSDNGVQIGIDNWDDGALISTNSGDTTNLAHAFMVGRNADSFWKGDIFEVIVFPTALSEANRRGVCLFLTDKWKLPYRSGIASESGAVSTVRVEMKVPSAKLPAWAKPSLHLKADAITGLSNNDPVGTWPDSSGNSRDATQATGTKKPLYKTNVQNSLPAVLFDGVDDLLTTVATLGNILGKDGWGSVYVAGQFQSSAIVQPFWAEAGNQVYLTATEVIGTQDVLEAGNFDTGQKTVRSPVIWTVGTWGTGLWFTRGTEDLTPPVGTNVGFDSFAQADLAEVASGATGAAQLANVINIGGSVGLGHLKGHIGELIFFPRSHSMADGEIAEIVSYLHEKWGLAYRSGTSAEPIWTDVSADVRKDFSLRYGIRGANVRDRVASPGELRLTLDNSAQNSAAKEGLYSPGHTNIRDGFRLGTPIRVSFEYFTTRYYKFLGAINAISVVPGKTGRPVHIKAGDWIDFASRATLRRLPIRTDENAGTLFWRLYVNSPQLPENIRFGVGSDTYPFAFDASRDEDIVILAEINRLTMSDMGLTYIQGNTLGGGELTFEPRGERGKNFPVAWTMTDQGALRSLELKDHTLDGIVNRIIVPIHPRRADADATTKLFRIQSTLELAPKGVDKSTRIFVAPYRDPDSGNLVRVGGIEMVTPVATTDYLFNSLADGTGTDLTANLTVTVVFGANAAEVTVKNDGTVLGHITKFELRGKGLYSFEEIIFDERDNDSITKYGQMTARIDMTYQSDLSTARDVGLSVLHRYKEPKTRIRSVTFLPNKTSDAMMHGLVAEIGARVALTEAVSGLSNAQYFVQGIEMVVRAGTWTIIKWLLAPAEQEDYWVLGVAGRSELGVTTTLTPGAITL